MNKLRAIIIVVLSLLSFELIPFSRFFMPPKGSSQKQKRKINTDIVDVALAGFASVVGASFQLTEDRGSGAQINATCYDTRGQAVLVNGPDKRPRVSLRLIGDFSGAFDSGLLTEAGTDLVVAKLQEKLAIPNGGAATAEPAVPPVVESPSCFVCAGACEEGRSVHDNCTAGLICGECFESQIEKYLSTKTSGGSECLFQNCKAPLSPQAILDHLQGSDSVVSAALQSRCEPSLIIGPELFTDTPASSFCIILLGSETASLRSNVNSATF